MKFDDIVTLICECLPKKINIHPGLEIFACERTKFENWVKVELVECFVHSFNKVIPEAGGIDIVIDNDIAIEIGKATTNYVYPGCPFKRKNITNDIDKIIKDITKLRNKSLAMKLVIFISFPCRHSRMDWQQKHLNRIIPNLTQYKYCEFNFKNGAPGIIYIGLI